MQIHFVLLKFLPFLPVIIFLISCNNGEDQNNQSSAIPYCEEKKTYSDSIKITGMAFYEYRKDGNGEVVFCPTDSRGEVISCGPTDSEGQSIPCTSIYNGETINCPRDSNGKSLYPNPIRYAEIRVTDSSGAVIQCGETGHQGNFSLDLPRKEAETATLSVISRSYNNFLKLYVLKEPKNNKYHSLDRAVTLDSSKDIGFLIAPARGPQLQAGAFNILDKILETNIFLRKQTENCNERIPDCTPFTVAPLTTVYWEAGINPYAYIASRRKSAFYIDQSFYDPEENHIYILGGENGDVDDSDTDHFDDTIIIHEYGHFLEKFYMNLSSPTGVHNGNSIIDPRLAFSEAWADFLPAQVTGVPCYLDTVGTIDGLYVSDIRPTEFDMEDGDLSCGPALSPTDEKNDLARSDGEGNFREFAIARALIDMVDESNEGEGVDRMSLGFDQIWTRLTSKTKGLGNRNSYFNNMGTFLQLQKEHSSGDDWNEEFWLEILEAEKLRPDEKDFGDSLVPDEDGVCEALRIKAEDRPSGKPENGEFSNSNLFNSNDFYEYRHEGGPFKLRISYRGLDFLSFPPLDIYLYADGYLYGQRKDMILFNEDPFSWNALDHEKRFFVSFLTPGAYMINIKVNTYCEQTSADCVQKKYGTVGYDLFVNGTRICPKILWEES